MTTGMSVGQANALLDALFRSVAYTDPAACWVQLHIGDPGVAGTSNAAGETDRQQATFSAAASGAVTTSGALTWTSVASTETYTHVSFWSASVAGTFLSSDGLEVSRAVTAGDDFTLPAGDIDLSITPIAA